jgi:hypothetical protein
MGLLPCATCGCAYQTTSKQEITQMLLFVARHRHDILAERQYCRCVKEEQKRMVQKRQTKRQHLYFLLSSLWRCIPLLIYVLVKILLSDPDKDNKNRDKTGTEIPKVTSDEARRSATVPKCDNFAEMRRRGPVKDTPFKHLNKDLSTSNWLHSISRLQATLSSMSMVLHEIRVNELYIDLLPRFLLALFTLL